MVGQGGATSAKGGTNAISSGVGGSIGGTTSSGTNSILPSGGATSASSTCGGASASGGAGVELRLRQAQEIVTQLDLAEDEGVADADDPRVQALCRGLQETVAAWLMKPVAALRDETGARSLVVSGGVACNSELRTQAKRTAERLDLALAIPEPRFCTDNGAMIASAGALLTPLEPVQAAWSLNADPNLPLIPV